jgi:hypothetical protein
MMSAELRVGINAQYPGNLLESDKINIVIEIATIAMVESKSFIFLLAMFKLA